MATLAMLAVTVGYLVAEVLWNAQLLDTLSNAGVARARVTSMVNHGRWLAAFGLVWALLRSMLFSRKSGLDSVVNWVLFASAIVIVYAATGTLYGKAIDSLSPATSMQAFELAAHRTWALKGDLAPQRQARAAAAAKDPTAVALWALFVTDPAVAADAHLEYMERRNGLSQDSVTPALALYPKIEAARKALAGGGSLMAEFDMQYEEYLSKSRRVESAPFAWVKRDAIKAFAEATCGMLPNAHATKAEFAQELTKSCVNDWRKAGRSFLNHESATTQDPVVYDNQGIRIRQSEVIKLDEAQFTRFVRDKAAGLVSEQLPTQESVKRNPRAHDVIAAVIVPPLSMTLSMLSIVANMGGALSLLVGLKRFQGLGAIVALVAGALFIPASSPHGMTQAWAAFTGSHGVLAAVAGRVITAKRVVLGAKVLP